MFNNNANTTFNHKAFNCRIIRNMRKNPELFSDQAKRLYEAAKKLRGVQGKSAVARLLNVLPAAIGNWEDGRPISSEALVSAQELIGCDAIWLRDGTGDMVRGRSTTSADLSDVAQLISLYGQADEKGRRLILDLAQDHVEVSRRSGGRTSHKH
jgi:hypothetical protein